LANAAERSYSAQVALCVEGSVPRCSLNLVIQPVHQVVGIVQAHANLPVALDVRFRVPAEAEYSGVTVLLDSPARCARKSLRP
jgi:hypothetical protein